MTNSCYKTILGAGVLWVLLTESCIPKKFFSYAWMSLSGGTDYMVGESVLPFSFHSLRSSVNCVFNTDLGAVFAGTFIV